MARARGKHKRILLDRCKLILLSVLLTFVALHAPWRLSWLAIETLVMQPGYLRMPQGVDSYWHVKDLEARLTILGWTISYQPDSERYYGVTSYNQHTIVINESLSWNAKYAVLAHEGGHALQPPRLTQEQSEIFAESVAALVTGWKVREPARYMASLKGDLLIMAVYWQEIYRAANMLQP